VHPDQLRAEHVGVVNHTQRTPHESMEIVVDPEEYDLLKGIMEDPMAFIRANVSLTTSAKTKTY